MAVNFGMEWNVSGKLSNNSLRNISRASGVRSLPVASNRLTASRAVTMAMPWKLPKGNKSRLSPEAMRWASGR